MKKTLSYLVVLVLSFVCAGCSQEPPLVSPESRPLPPAVADAQARGQGDARPLPPAVAGQAVGGFAGP